MQKELVMRQLHMLTEYPSGLHCNLYAALQLLAGFQTETTGYTYPYLHWQLQVVRK